ncbi:MAG: acylphosphatase [Actinomycetota bacterium]|nr:acylphosphatase [Actinomycetota bacterium]MDQ6911214.1 acylphosphatase [Actinomycetota bacterium]
MDRATVYVRGHVQGVGFRWWVRARALDLGLSGHARNLPDGRVEIVAQGGAEAVDRLLAMLEESPSTSGRPGTVGGVVTRREPGNPGAVGFDLQ